jgi:hypothetical protein
MWATTEAIEAQPKQHFRFAELAAIAYGEPVTRALRRHPSSGTSS